MYSKEVMSHFQNPRNLGAIPDAHAVGCVGNPTCGDMMKIYLKISDKDIIQEIGFETLGCVAAIAVSSMVTELAKGKTISEAENIKFADIEDGLASLPPAKRHCVTLSIQALKAAIKEYRDRER